MNKPALALDLDDLIFPFMELYVPHHNARHGSELSCDDFHTFSIEAVVGGTRSEAIESVLDFFHELVEHPEPVEGAVEGITRLSSRYELHIVTSRQDSLRDETIDWISTMLPGRVASVHLCNNFVVGDHPSKKPKAAVCIELGAIGLVDDSLDYVTEVAQHGMRGLLFGNFAWNQCEELPQGVVRVRDWNDVLRELMEA